MTTIAALDSDIIETHLLTKLDGPSLVSAASTCHFLNTLCNKESLWEDICNSAWNSIKHPLVRHTISSFPAGYRSFYSDSFPLLRANVGQRMLRGHAHAHASELISAVDIHYENKTLYSKVIVNDTNTNTSAPCFPGSLFSINLIECKETVEIPLEYQGNENARMSKLERGLRLSWIVIDPALKRAANVSSLRPVFVRPHWDGIKVIYSTFLSGDCCGIHTMELVECRIVTIFKCDEGKMLRLREVSLCVVDMVRTRLDRGKSLRILEAAMERGGRKKENGDGKKMYGKYLELKRKKKEEQKRRQDRIYVVLRGFQAIIWVFFAISLISLLWPA